jgi:methionine synthase I (cobalamin-dependent)
MVKQKIAEILRTRKVLVSDGAWGTFLYLKGLQPGEYPDEWSLTHLYKIEDIAQSYLLACSDMIETNAKLPVHINGEDVFQETLEVNTCISTACGRSKHRRQMLRHYSCTYQSNQKSSE